MPQPIGDVPFPVLLAVHCAYLECINDALMLIEIEKKQIEINETLAQIDEIQQKLAEPRRPML